MVEIKGVWERMKKIKHFPIIVAIVVALLLCVVYFSFFATPKTDKIEDNSTMSFSSSEEYVTWLENKLNNVLSSISGAGHVSTIITLESGFSYDYAKSVETRTSTGQDIVISSETLVLVDGEPVVVKEWFPVIKGVVIVASGASDFSVKMKILDATEAVLEIDRNDIKVLS